MSKCRIAAPVRWPWVPSASTVALAIRSEPGSKFESSSPSRPRPLSPLRTPTDLAVVHQQLRGGGLAEDVHARVLGLLGEPAAELRDRGHVVAVVAERRRRGLERDRPLAVRQQVDRVLRRTVPNVGQSSSGRSGNSFFIAEGFIIAPDSRCDPGPLPFSTSAIGTSPSDSEQRLVLGEQLRAAGWRMPARPDRRPRSPRPPRSARPRDRWARRRTPSRSRRAAGTRSGRWTAASPSWPSRPR